MTPTLDDRGAQVLRLVVEDYIETAEPVGSRPISKKMGQVLSHATNRKILGGPEETGETRPRLLERWGGHDGLPRF